MKEKRTVYLSRAIPVLGRMRQAYAHSRDGGLIRFDGNRELAWPLCDYHAGPIVQKMLSQGYELNQEPAPTGTPCKKCQWVYYKSGLREARPS